MRQVLLKILSPRPLKGIRRLKMSQEAQLKVKVR